METSEILNELKFKAVRSSGPGGQNVNKVASKVVLSFDVANSKALSDEEKSLLMTKLAPRLTSESILNLQSGEDRSQLKNKEIVTKRFLELIEKSLIVPKTRKKTKIPKSVIEKRLAHKKSISAIKKSRKRPNANGLNPGE